MCLSVCLSGFRRWFWRSFVRPLIAHSTRFRRPWGQIHWVAVFFFPSDRPAVRRFFAILVFVFNSFNIIYDYYYYYYYQCGGTTSQRIPRTSVGFSWTFISVCLSLCKSLCLYLSLPGGWSKRADRICNQSARTVIACSACGHRPWGWCTSRFKIYKYYMFINICQLTI